METKYCPDCKEERPIEEFSFKNIKKGTYQSHCNPHRRERARISYENNKPAAVARSAKTKKRNRTLAHEWKSRLKCVVCVESERCCLDFHHLDPTLKENSIADLVGQGCGLKTVFKEAQKCIVVCKNCHTKIHEGIVEISQQQIDSSKQSIEESFAYVYPHATNVLKG